MPNYVGVPALVGHPQFTAFLGRSTPSLRNAILHGNTSSEPSRFLGWLVPWSMRPNVEHRQAGQSVEFTLHLRLWIELSYEHERGAYGVGVLAASTWDSVRGRICNTLDLGDTLIPKLACNLRNSSGTLKPSCSPDIGHIRFTCTPHCLCATGNPGLP